MRIRVSTLKRAGLPRIVEALGVDVSGSHGHELSCGCPYCGKSGHFWISTRTGAWICFRCDERGGIIRLVADQLDLEWDDAVRWLRDKAGFKVRSDSAREIRKQLRAMIADSEKQPDDLRAVVPKTARPVVTSPAALRWLRGRQISEEVARDRDLRWCDSGRWGGRIIVPIRDLDGRPLTFIARRIDDVKEKRYLHPTGPNKSRTIYAPPTGDEVVVVEGVMDALRWITEGVPAAAVLGSSMSKAQELACKQYRSVTLCFDGDEKGREGQAKARKRLQGQVEELRLVELPEGMDPGDTQASDVLPGQLVGDGSAIARRLRRRFRDVRTEVSLMGGEDERTGRDDD